MPNNSFRSSETPRTSRIVPGVIPEDCLRNGRDSTRCQCEQKCLGVHPDVGGHPHVVTKGGQEQHRHVGRTEEPQVLPGCLAPAGYIVAGDSEGLIVGSTLGLAAFSVLAVEGVSLATERIWSLSAGCR